MDQIDPWLHGTSEHNPDTEPVGNEKVRRVRQFRKVNPLARKPGTTKDTHIANTTIDPSKPIESLDTAKTPQVINDQKSANTNAMTDMALPIESFDTAKTPQVANDQDKDTLSTDQQSTNTVSVVSPDIVLVTTLKTPSISLSTVIDADTQPIPTLLPPQNGNTFINTNISQITTPPSQDPPLAHRPLHINRRQALAFIALLCIVLAPVLNTSFTQFQGAQGWAAVFTTTGNISNSNLLHTLRSGRETKTGTSTATSITPQQYINQIINNMSLDQKLGQLMFVECICSSYTTSADLSTMVTLQDVGAIILSSGNNNIINATQLKTLTRQIQQNAPIPLLISTDQEGGEVDRLAALDGPSPSAASIGQTNDPTKAKAQGILDAQNLSAYGLNLNIAPVVDVDNLSSSILHQEGRTYGDDPTTVTNMAGAYLEGLQQSGKVFGTLKHFPGLGDVSGDPHSQVTELYRTKSEMEQIDWAPYRALIQKGLVHAIMVTHEILPAIDPTMPASLSAKVVQDILRDEMGFQGVIMTDSLTMVGVSAYATLGNAAALAIEAGSDLLMGAASAADVTTMINGIKDAINTGAISQQRIDASVKRILLLKYELGLLPIPKNATGSTGK